MKGALFTLVAGVASLFALLNGPLTVRADDDYVLAIHADVSRQLFGPGTGVIVGIVDSGVNSAHPALTGNDSQGNPRLVAAQNFASDGGSNPADVGGHGTEVASAALSSDPVHTGIAPDARYINARVLDSNNAFNGSSEIMNAVGYTVSQGADVINLSLNYFPPSTTDGSDPIDRILDWAASQGVNITVSAANNDAHRDANGEAVLDDNYPVRSPGSAYNVVTVGRTGTPPGDPLGPIGPNTVLQYNQVFINSASGPINSPSGIATRDKPDLVAPGTRITLANNDFVSGVPSTYWNPGINGTSVSAPLVAGLMAQQIGYGKTHGLSTNPLVIKATMMNSADQVLNKDGSPWQPRASSSAGGVLQSTAPLDVDSGAGQVNGARLYQQYTAGQQGPGLINSIGWDLHNISGVSSTTYTLNTLQAAGSQMNVSLDWLRHVDWTDFNNNHIADSSDAFTAHVLDNLDLSVLVNGSLVAESISTTDNVEFLQFLLPQSGTVSIQVNELSVPDAPMAEMYGLAWSVTAVPEPSAIVLAACGALLLSFHHSRGRRRSRSNG